jgi:uncharacterized protein YecT (DUF1311 family)
MRAIILAIVAIQIGSGHVARADNSLVSDRSIRETLPLFEKNHCAAFPHPAEQLFCGDPELNDAAARLNSAIQDRLDRLPNRSLAIEENAEWIADRNSSCGIFAAQNISNQDVKSIKTCLLKETEERIAILSDPNFDCLATNTAAGMLICSEPSLATAKAELNSHVLGLIAKLKGDEARAAFAEYERWSRERDRRCNLTDKENVPLEELSPSESLPGGVYQPENSGDRRCQRRPQTNLWTASVLARARRRRGRFMRRANPFGQRLRGLPFGQSRLPDRHRRIGAGGPGDGRG